MFETIYYPINILFPTNALVKCVSGILDGDEYGLKASLSPMAPGGNIDCSKWNGLGTIPAKVLMQNFYCPGTSHSNFLRIPAM